MTNQIFFELLQSAIWQRPCSLELFAKKPDWNAILTLCEEHHVLGVVGDTIMSLPEQVRPGRRNAQRISDYIGHQIRLLYNNDETTSTVFKALQDANIHAVLLKGQVIAAFYPERCMRSCGDIDIYVGEKQYEEACRIVNAICGNESNNEGLFEDRVHYHASTKDTNVDIEVHRKVGETALPEDFEDFNAWAEEMLQPENCSHMVINGVTIPTPSERFLVVFVYEHLTKHLVTKGIGIRQFLDWALILHSFMERHAADKQWMKQLEKDLKHHSSYNAWQILSGILTLQLGLPTSHCAFWKQRKAAKSQGMVLDFIVKSGNFGKHLSWSDAIKNMERGWKRQYKALSMMLAHAKMLWNISHKWSRAYLKDMLKPIILRHLGKEVSMMER